MDQFPLVYRCAVIVKPRQPFFDWVKRLMQSSIEISLEELQRDCHVYLVPDYEDVPVIEKAIQKYLKLNYADIFLNELTAWDTDEEKFPKLSYKLFLEWFELSSNTMIFDTLDEPLEKDG